MQGNRRHFVTPSSKGELSQLQTFRQKTENVLFDELIHES